MDFSSSNIPESIRRKLDKNLHNIPNHPIEIIKSRIYKYFDSTGIAFKKFDDFSPFVSVEDNFDKLLIPTSHPARSRSDTYYLNDSTVLRTHTSAHQNELLKNGDDNFLVTGDVYRKDEIDRHHYPVFHQMEGMVFVDFNKSEEDELINILGGLVKNLFPDCEYRVNSDYFPFTNPSYEFEVNYFGRWIEILGCGVVRKEILDNNNKSGKYIAFGLGLERLAMILFDIPDIRYFWSDSKKFLDQFKSNSLVIKFSPYSNLSTQYNDISFWINPDRIINDKWVDENDFFEVLRNVCGEYVELVDLKDSFVHPQKGYSRMYRITYSPNDASLKNPSEFTEICNNLQNMVRKEIASKINVILR